MENYRDIPGSEYYDLEEYKKLVGRTALVARTTDGKLPMIMIAGYPFFVDIRMERLRPMSDFSTEGLDINGGSYDQLTGHRYYYYHVPTRTEVVPAGDITEYPKDTVQIRLPDHYSLDPVGMARKYGKEDTYFTTGEKPMRMYRVAKVIPLHRTGLRAIIDSNRKDAGLEPLKVPTEKKIIKNSKRP